MPRFNWLRAEGGTLAGKKSNLSNLLPIPITFQLFLSDQTGYITVQVEGNPAPTFKFYKVKLAFGF